MTVIAFIFLILVLLFSLKYAWWAPSIDNNETRIMMYHMISDQLANSKKSGLRVSPYMFEKHLEYFSNNGWTFIKMSEIEEYDNSEKVVAITFDDGYLDNYTQAYPLLKKYNACATLYLVVDRHDNDWSIKKNPKHNKGILAKEKKLSDDQIQEMILSGVFELGGHTISHPYLPDLTFNEKFDEINNCKDVLEQKFNTKVHSFAYPFGIYEDEDIKIVSNSDFNSAVSTNEGIASLKSIYNLKRIKASGKDNFFAFKIRVLKGFRGYI